MAKTCFMFGHSDAKEDVFDSVVRADAPEDCARQLHYVEKRRYRYLLCESLRQHARFIERSAKTREHCVRNECGIRLLRKGCFPPEAGIKKTFLI